MTAFTLRIDLGNDAMRQPWDVSDALLRQVVPALARDETQGSISDANGNVVGKWVFPPVALEE